VGTRKKAKGRAKPRRKKPPTSKVTRRTTGRSWCLLLAPEFCGGLAACAVGGIQFPTGKPSPLPTTG
jgi:hypothetical protein